jgi:DNA-binding NarL/FixJ family response regulator
LYTIRVLLVDDHPIVRAGIHGIIKGAMDISIVGEASDGYEAMEMARKLLPNVMLLDMHMPGLSGIEVAHQCQKEKLPVRILALSAYDDRQYVQCLVTAGMAGYLTKEEAPDMLVEALRGVGRGEQGWVSRKVAVQLPYFVRDDYRRMGLTAREMEVLQLIVNGKTNMEIGRLLQISEKTVQKHVNSIYSKLGVVSRVEAAVRVVRAGLA